MTAEELIERKRDFSVVWLKFLQRFQRNPDQEIWIFEGKDDLEYYSARIEMHFGNRPSTNVIVAQGKQNSLRLRKTLTDDPEYGQCKVAFFIDTDFDEQATLTGSHTYLTPCYAIENFYFSIDSVDRFLTDRLQLFDENDRSEIATVLSKVRAWRSEAVAVLIPYCALMALAKAHGESSNDLTAFLRDQMFTEVVALRRTSEGIETVATMSPLDVRDKKMSNWALTTDDLQAQIELWTNEWGGDLHNIVRGKFLIPWLSMLLAFLIEDSNKRKTRAVFSRRRPCPHQIREPEVIASLSRFADTPDCLVRFLNGLATKWQEAREPLLLV